MLVLERQSKKMPRKRRWHEIPWNEVIVKWSAVVGAWEIPVNAYIR